MDGKSEANPNPGHTEVSVNQTFPTSYSRLSQLRGLLLKSATHQKRQPVTLCCQLFIPIILMLLLGILKVVIENAINDSSNNNNYVPYYNYENVYSPSLPYSGGCPAFHLGIVNDTTVNLGFMDGNNSMGYLGEIYQYWSGGGYSTYQYPLVTTNYASVSALNEDYLAGQQKIYEYSREFSNGNFPSPTPLPNGTYIQWCTNLTTPWFGYKINSFDTATNTKKLGISAIWNDDSDNYNQAGSEPPSFYPKSGALLWLINGALNGLLRMLGSTAYVEAQTGNLPYNPDYSFNFDIMSIGATLLPWCFSFLLPVYLFELVYEKQEKLLEMMKMFGMKMPLYWSVIFLYNYLFYSIIVLICFIIGLAFQISFFMQTVAWLHIVSFIGWGLSQICFAFMLSTFFSKTRPATIVSYLLVIASCLASTVCNQIVWLGDPANVAYLLWPPFAFYRILYLASTACASGNCPNSADITGDYTTSLLVVWISAPIFMILAIYFDQVLPREFGVRKHPLFFLQFCKRTKDETAATEADPLDVNHTDSDVLQEDKETTETTSAQSKEYPIIIKNLRKVFGDKVAVNRVSLRLRNGECFGLLGPNGAGKTTTISMLTGLIEPSAGAAFVSGYDIRSEMDDVHTKIGVCPQFDIFWADLTVQETLLFYCRLRGIPKAMENEAVRVALKRVALENDLVKKVKELSGGMKRRLSVAVALVGEPPVLFFDEPSTGLDVENRRHLWDVLLAIKPGKCIVLTTHSMEEADVLCDRLGIVASGLLKCLGTNVHLKEKFGSGYTIKVNFDPNDEQKVIEFIMENFPKAVKEESFPGSAAFRIPRDAFVMSQTLQVFLDNQEKLHIRDMGIGVTSLEDVFLNIVRNEESAQAAVNK